MSTERIVNAAIKFFNSISFTLIEPEQPIDSENKLSDANHNTGHGT
jgi:hypothetical protein